MTRIGPWLESALVSTDVDNTGTWDIRRGYVDVAAYGDSFWTDPAWATVTTAVAFNGQVETGGLDLGPGVAVSEAAYIWDIQSILAAAVGGPSGAWPSGAVSYEVEDADGTWVSGTVSGSWFVTAPVDTTTPGDPIGTGATLARVTTVGVPTTITGAPMPGWQQAADLGNVVDTLPFRDYSEYVGGSWTNDVRSISQSVTAPDDTGWLMLVAVATMLTLPRAINVGEAAQVVTRRPGTDGRRKLLLTVTYRPPRYRFIFAGRTPIRGRQRASGVIGTIPLRGRQGDKWGLRGRQNSNL